MAASETPDLFSEMSGELVGSFLLVFFGTGSVAVAVLTGALQGLWQVATVWGFAIGLIIYSVGAVSGAHLNPAVTIAMAVFRKADFPARKILPYIAAQMAGGVLGSLVVLALFAGTCAHFEATKGIVRGAPGSQLSAMWFGEYFPNPGIYGTDATAFSQVSVAGGFLGEMIGTALLLYFIMALTDKCNKLAPIQQELPPVPDRLRGGGHHQHHRPADPGGLEPHAGLRHRGWYRYFAGWGSIAIPGPRGCEWWVYIVAPIVGGLLGALVYEKAIQPHQTGERVAAGRDPDECVLPGGCCPVEAEES